MKLSCLPVLRAALLASVCALVFPSASKAENPLTNISGKIKNGVSNVGTAIKKTAKAAKNIVTPGKAAEEKPAAPRPAAAPGGSKPKKAPAAATSPSAKPKRETPPATPKPAAQAASKPKAKSTPPAATASVSKSKPRTKTPSTAGNDSGDRPKSRKKAADSAAARDEETASTPSQKQRDSADAVPETAAVQPQPAGAMMEAGDRNEEPSPSADEAKPAEKLLFGTPAFGRKGFVYSPYAPDQGLIDVRNVAAGAKVRCPYTGNIFRVP